MYLSQKERCGICVVKSVVNKQRMTAQMICFAKQTLQAISEMFIDLPNDGSTTVFGERRVELSGRKYVFRPGFQTDPWTRGVVPYPPQPSVS